MKQITFVDYSTQKHGNQKKDFPIGYCGICGQQITYWSELEKQFVGRRHKATCWYA